ncbi:DUF4097 family beta strand repeat-containing protein [Streptomyces sp. NPDC004069]
MRQRVRALGILAATVVAAGQLAACGLAQGKTFEDDSTLSGKITSVRLETRAGSVTVNGTKGNGGLSLHRSVTYRGDKPRGATHRIEDGVLVLGGCGSRCSVSYTVDVPAGVPVSGGTSNGSVHLTHVGAVKLSTSSGTIELNGVSGPVEARTSNGRISGHGITGPRIRARTSNGSIDLTLDTAQDVRARTSNGHISLTVPEARYKVTAKAGNGARNIDVTDDPSGEHRLDLTTSNGAITVKHS